jgi:lysophospholipase L1-like esterase
MEIQKNFLRNVSMKCFLALTFLLFTLLPSQLAAQQADYGNTGRYAQDNAALPSPKKGEKRVVFLGNSITELWMNTHPDFFKSHGFIPRGISGQTSYNFLLRFREDVVKLHPYLVIINAGTNDVAENSCTYREELTIGNIISMVDIAKANKIKVILTSVLPAARFGWRKEITDAPAKIAALNARIKAYAAAHKIPYVDYFTPLVDTDGKTLKPQYSNDGVHPTAAGYDIMEPIILLAIKKAL